MSEVIAQLGPEQQARARALLAARAALEPRNTMLGVATSAGRTSGWELVEVAEWILTGEWGTGDSLDDVDEPKDVPEKDHDGDELAKVPPPPEG